MARCPAQGRRKWERWLSVIMPQWVGGLLKSCRKKQVSGDDWGPQQLNCFWGIFSKQLMMTTCFFWHTWGSWFIGFMFGKDASARCLTPSQQREVANEKCWFPKEKVTKPYQIMIGWKSHHITSNLQTCSFGKSGRFNLKGRSQPKRPLGAFEPKKWSRLLTKNKNFLQRKTHPAQ